VPWTTSTMSIPKFSMNPTDSCKLVISFCERALIGFPSTCYDRLGNVQICTTYQRYVYRAEFVGECSFYATLTDEDRIKMAYDDLWKNPPTALLTPCEPGIDTATGKPYTKMVGIRPTCWKKTGTTDHPVYIGACDSDGAKCIMTCDVCYLGNADIYVGRFNCTFTQQGTPNPNLCPLRVVGSPWPFEECFQVPCISTPHATE
jgi:hypothetical protein